MTSDAPTTCSDGHSRFCSPCDTAKRYGSLHCGACGVPVSPRATVPASAAALPPLWWIETNRSPILVMAYANAMRGSVVERSFYGLTQRGCRRRAVRWIERHPNA